MKTTANFTLLLAACIAHFGVLLTAARGELKVVKSSNDGERITTYRMTVTPAAEPSPVLKHRLTLRESDLKPGNAATHYLRSYAESWLSGTWERLEEEHGSDELHSWYGDEIPLAELPLENAREAAEAFDGLVNGFIATASERDHCDWGHNLSELSGPEIYGFLLPEIQESRSLSRALQLRTRVAIAYQDYDKAIDQIRMNYSLGQNVATSPFLVSALVGIAEASIANAGVIELISAPNSPNLYWALAELPKPLVSVRESMRLEMSLLPRIFPVIGEAEVAEHSADEWTRLLVEASESLEMLNGSSLDTPTEVRQLALTGTTLVVYPAAKQRLIANGMDAVEVERMSVGHVVALDALHESRRLSDEMEKSFYISFPQLREFGQSDPFDVHGTEAITRGYGYVICSLLLPAVNGARSAEVRLSRHIHAIQAVEAVRMHAAETGSLPSSLDEITCVPVPENPCTGEPFQYRLDGDTAVLDLPTSDGFVGHSWRFEIKLAE